MPPPAATIDRTDTADVCRCPAQGVHCAWQQELSTAVPHGLACPLGQADQLADRTPPAGDWPPPEIWLG